MTVDGSGSRMKPIFHDGYVGQDDRRGGRNGRETSKSRERMHPVAVANQGRVNSLCGGGSCWTHTGYPAHLVNAVKTGKAVVVGLEEPEAQSRRKIYVDSIKEDCEVCDG